MINLTFYINDTIEGLIFELTSNIPVDIYDTVLTSAIMYLVSLCHNIYDQVESKSFKYKLGIHYTLLCDFMNLRKFSLISYLQLTDTKKRTHFRSK